MLFLWCSFISFCCTTKQVKIWELIKTFFATVPNHNFSYLSAGKAAQSGMLSLLNNKKEVI